LKRRPTLKSVQKHSPILESLWTFSVYLTNHLEIELTVRMPVLTMCFGILLSVLGIAGFVGTGCRAPTALVPASFGVSILLLGVVAARSARRRRLAMHWAMGMALVGAVSAAVRAFPNVSKASTLEGGHLVAFWMQILMVMLCLSFLGCCVRSFVNARKGRS